MVAPAEVAEFPVSRRQNITKDLKYNFVRKAFEEVPTGGMKVLDTLRIWRGLHERVVKLGFVLPLEELGSIAFVLGKLKVLVELRTDKPVKTRKPVIWVRSVGPGKHGLRSLFSWRRQDKHLENRLRDSDCARSKGCGATTRSYAKWKE